MQDRFPPPWQPTDPPSASHLNAMLDMLRSVQNVSGGGATEVTQLPHGTAVYTPNAPPPAVRQPWVTISASESGLGMYSGFELTLATADIDPTADVTLAMIGTAKTESILIVNEKERGSTASGPFLSAGGAYPATWSPAKATDGRRVAIVREDDPEVCTP